MRTSSHVTSDRAICQMGELQWDYNRELAALAGLPAPGQAVERLYTAVSARRRAALPHYKRDSYQLQGEAFTGRVFDHQADAINITFKLMINS